MAQKLLSTLDNTSSQQVLPTIDRVDGQVQNFDECSDVSGSSDVALYLPMDNSTSMLQSIPLPRSVCSNRLEAQDRVAFTLKQALAKAGYGFSRKGSGEVLGDSDFPMQ